MELAVTTGAGNEAERVNKGFDEKVIRNRSWESLWEVWGSSWGIFGRLSMIWLCLGGFGGSMDRLLEALGRIWEAKRRYF